MPKRKSPPATANEPLAAYGHQRHGTYMAFGVESAIDKFLLPLIQHKRRTRSKQPTWATVAEVIGTYTRRNELILQFLDALEEAELRALFDRSNQYLKNWESIDPELRDPAVRTAMEANKESMRQIKMKSRSLLEKDMRDTIARSIADHMKSRS